MRFRKIWPVLGALLITTLACGPSINLPATDLKTGPTVTEEVLISTPNADSVDLSLEIGAGTLTLNPGAEAGLVEGTVMYNVEDFKPVIQEIGGQVSLSMGDIEFQGIPSFDDEVINEWDLALASTPISLRISAGAYSGRFDFGGLSLENLRVEDGAADVEIDFSSPNLSEMAFLDYQTGASSVDLTNLGNANFTSMVFISGAGDYNLEFGGDWQRDANVKIESGLSNMALSFPPGLNVKLTFSGGLANVSTRGTWTVSGDTYTLSGDGPTVTITLDMSAGNLELVAP